MPIFHSPSVFYDYPDLKKLIMPVLNLKQGQLYISDDSKEIPVSDPWGLDPMVFLFPRAKGHDHWSPLTVRICSDQEKKRYCIVLLNRKKPTEAAEWYLNERGEFLKQNRIKINEEDILDLFTFEPTSGAIIVELLLNAPVDKKKLAAGAIKKYYDTKTAISPTHIKLIKAIAHYLTGDADSFTKELHNLELFDNLDFLFVVTFIDSYLLKFSPRYPKIAMDITTRLINNRKNVPKDILVKVKELLAKALHALGKHIEAEEIFCELAQDESFFAKGDVILYCFSCLAQDKVFDALTILERGIACNRPNVRHLLFIYNSIIKVVDFNYLGGSHLKYLDFSTLSEPQMLCLLANLSNDPAFQKNIQHTLLDELVNELLDREAQGKLVSLMWDYIAEIYLDLPRNEQEPRILSLLSDKTSTIYQKQLADVKIADSFQEIVRRIRPFNPRKQSIALTVSGFLREYSKLYVLKKQVEQLSKSYNVFIFFYLFDRLGDLRSPGHCPSKYRDYSNGGFEREIKKTKFIDKQRICSALSIDDIVIIKRESDGFYLNKLGIQHPQWYMVNCALDLAESYSSSKNIQFSYAARLRLDLLPGRGDGLVRAFRDLEMEANPNLIYTMSRWKLGAYQLSDRLAVGSWKSVRKYGCIGQGKNFIDVEKTDLWKIDVGDPYRSSGGSHESHLGCWLKLNSIDFTAKDYLDP